MRRTKGVKFAFGALREAAQAAQLAQRGHAFTPPGEDFVRVSLMPHVPYHPVMRGIKDIVQRYREFYGAQVGAQMAAGFGHTFQQKGTQLGSQGVQLFARQAPHVSWRMNRLQQGIRVIHQHKISF